MERIMKESVKKIQQVFKKLKEQGTDINFQDPKVMHTLNSVRMDDIKQSILQEEGLEDFDEPGS